MKFLIVSSTLLVTAALPSLAQTASGGASAGAGTASPSAAASGGVSATRATTANGVTVQGNGTRVVNPVNPNTGLFTTPSPSAAAPTPNGSAAANTPNGTTGATTQNGSTTVTTQDPNNPNNGFAPAAGSTNNHVAFTNNFQNGTNFAGLNGTNGVFTASNQFGAFSNYVATNAFAGTNSSANDRGMTTFDTTLIFHIRRTVFDANPQLSALSELVNFLSQGGNVTVSGVVPNPELQTTVVNNVRAVPGVVNVTSRLVIDPRAAEVFARAKQPKPQPLLAPASDRALGDSRIYSGNSNQVNTGTSTSTGQGTASNSVDTSTSISTP